MGSSAIVSRSHECIDQRRISRHMLVPIASFEVLHHVSKALLCCRFCPFLLHLVHLLQVLFSCVCELVGAFCVDVPGLALADVCDLEAAAHGRMHCFSWC